MYIIVHAETARRTYLLGRCALYNFGMRNFGMRTVDLCGLGDHSDKRQADTINILISLKPEGRKLHMTWTKICPL